MKRSTWTQLVAVVVAFCGCRGETAVDSMTKDQPAKDVASEASPSQLIGEPTIDPIYTVAEYAPERDADDDLKATVERATSEGKRIILEIGGQW
jgi:hypothetical protein